MSSNSVGLLSSPDQSSSPTSIDLDENYQTPPTTTTSQIYSDHPGSILQLLPRSPTKRHLTLEETFSATNDPKRLCNRLVEKKRT